MNSYKIKFILIAIKVLIIIDTIHADERNECIDSLNTIGYESGSVSENYTEFLNRIFFISDNFEDFENRMLKKKNKCLSQDPVPDDARACLELGYDKEYLFKESKNNWAYRYECAMLTSLYEIEVMLPEEWCTVNADALTDEFMNSAMEYALIEKFRKSPMKYALIEKFRKSPMKYELTDEILESFMEDPLTDEFMNSAMEYPLTDEFMNSAMEYPLTDEFMNSAMEYALIEKFRKSPMKYALIEKFRKSPMKYALIEKFRKSPMKFEQIDEFIEYSMKYCIDELLSNELNFKNGIHYYFYFFHNLHNYHIDYQNYPIQLESETENVTDSLKINENNNSSNTMEVDEKTQNDIIEKKKNNYEENVLDWCRSHSMTANTHFIKKKKKKLDEVPHKFRLELEMDFIRVCNAVLIAEGYTKIVVKRPYFILEYQKYIFSRFKKSAEKLPPGNIEWCEQNIKTDSKANSS